MFLYCYFLLFVIIFFVLSEKFMNFGLGINFLKVCFLSILIVSCAVSFGIFLSTLAPSENMSIVILIGFYICMGSLLILEKMLGLPTHGNINIIQNMFLKIIHLSRRIDPIHYFSLGMSSISDGGKELLDFKLFKTSIDKYILSVLESTIYSAIMIVASIISMKIKGVK